MESGVDIVLQIFKEIEFLSRSFRSVDLWNLWIFLCHLFVERGTLEELLFV